MEQVNISRADNRHREEIEKLLIAMKLPTDDLPAELEHFLIASEDQDIIAAIGLETYGQFGLLRSLVVDPDHRNKNIAGKLVARLEASAAASGLVEMYLLTETAPEYFLKKGYTRISRADVPPPIMTSSEFMHTCPKSAIVMKKRLINQPSA